MENLRGADVLSIFGIRNTPLPDLELLVRPAGYFRQKATRLKQFVAHVDTRHGGSLDALFAQPTEELREELLGLPGIGPETADSILLYAASREVFVVDTYTRRIFERHGLAKTETGYDEIRLGVQHALAGDRNAERGPVAPTKVTTHEPSTASQMERSELSRRHNEFHALIVQTAKHFCVKAVPKCEGCPLMPVLGPGSRLRR